MTFYNIKTKTADKCRVYESPNGIQPSVTSICDSLMKYALIDWAANCAVDHVLNYSIHPSEGPMEADDRVITTHDILVDARTAHRRISKEAADTGTNAHLLCSLWIESLKDSGKTREFDKILAESPDIEIQLFRAFMDWATTEEIEPVYTELVLHGDGYSGRCDLIARRKGVLGLYDIKTGKGSYYPEWGLQLAAYAEAYERMAIFDYENLYNHWATGDYEGEEPEKPLFIDEIGIIKLNKETLKCNFSEDTRGPKFTQHRDRLTRAFLHLKDFYWAYNDLKTQFEELTHEPTQKTVS